MSLDYKNWIFERWQTPVSDLPNLGIDNLTENSEGLMMTLRGGADSKSIYLFMATDYIAYRNIDETYLLALWQTMTEKNLRLGNTLFISNSPWIQELSSSEPLVKAHNPSLRHYMIKTQDDVFELLANQPPRIALKPF